MKQKIIPSEYIENERRDYAIYVLQHRAIPSIADGFKAATRRILWTARSGDKWKTATLAGATMSIHPHGAPDGAANTLAAPYGNNIPILTGIGNFGTLVIPNQYAASRYTSVKVSEFAKDAVLVDMPIIPMIDNYDGTLEEPKHFLPLIPIVLLNPQDGVAIGFASSILPRSLNDIINSQLEYLKSKKIPQNVFPYFKPIDNKAIAEELNRQGNPKWIFEGEYEIIGTNTIRITKIPYGVYFDDFIEKLISLEENEEIASFKDMTKEKYCIEVKFKKGYNLSENRDEIISKLNLRNAVSENMVVLDFDGENVLQTNYSDIIQKFTDWRLVWYSLRYQRLKRLIEEDIQRFRDIITAINKNVGGVAKKIKDKAELIEFLESIKIVNLEYIASLPVYRFTEDEKFSVEKKIEESLKKLAEYNEILDDPDRRVKIYMDELKEIKKKYA